MLAYFSEGCVGVSWRACSVADCWAHPQSVWFCRFGVGPEDSHSYTLLWDAHAADPGNHLRIAGMMKHRTAFSLVDIIVVFKTCNSSRNSIGPCCPWVNRAQKTSPHAYMASLESLWKKAESLMQTPDLLYFMQTPDLNLYFNKIPKWSKCTLKLEKYWGKLNLVYVV